MELTDEVLALAWRKMNLAVAMADMYETNHAVTSKYVHATSRGHEAIQLAVGLQLTPKDFVYPYYRDDAMLLGLGMEPYDLMLQLFPAAIVRQINDHRQGHQGDH